MRRRHDAYHHVDHDQAEHHIADHDHAEHHVHEHSRDDRHVDDIDLKHEYNESLLPKRSGMFERLQLL
jgi:hypothetical protein